MARSNTTIKKGDNKVSKPKGAKHKTTLVKQSVGLTGWDTLCDYVKNAGAQKYVETMSQLRGRDYIVAYNAMTEYVKPKLARTEVIGDPNKPIEMNITSGMSFQELYQLKYGKLPRE